MLCGLDRAAHHSMFKRKAFTDIAEPEKAREVANSITQDIIAFCTACFPPVDAARLSAVLQQQGSVIETLSREALTLKLDMLLSHDSYSLIRPESGSLFDGEIMSPITIPEDPVRIPDISMAIQTCLAPGLLTNDSCIVQNDSTLGSPHWTKALINYEFKRYDHTDTRSSEVVCKAIVR